MRESGRIPRLKAYALLLLWHRAEPANAEPCRDDSPECPNWAQNYECDTNPGYMLEACRLSCGVCAPARKSRATSGASSSKKRSESAANANADAEAKPGANPLDSGAYTLQPGRLKGSKQLESRRMPLSDAVRWCEQH